MLQPSDVISGIRDVAAKIQRLEDKLMGRQVIPLAEQQTIHGEIRRLRKEQDALEQRTRHNPTR